MKKLICPPAILFFASAAFCGGVSEIVGDVRHIPKISLRHNGENPSVPAKNHKQKRKGAVPHESAHIPGLPHDRGLRRRKALGGVFRQQLAN